MSESGSGPNEPRRIMVSKCANHNLEECPKCGTYAVMSWRPFEPCKENLQGAKVAEDLCGACGRERTNHNVRHVFVESDPIREAKRRAHEEQKSIRAPVGWAGFLERHKK